MNTTGLMKSIAVMILLCAVAIPVQAGAPTADSGGLTLVVTAKHGLKLWETVGKDPKLLTAIPTGESVTLKSVSLEMVTISGVKGFWAFVDYKGKAGYAFSGFLKRKTDAAFMFRDAASVAGAGYYAEGAKAEFCIDELAAGADYASGILRSTMTSASKYHCIFEIKGFKDKPAFKTDPCARITVSIDKARPELRREKVDATHTIDVLDLRVSCTLIEKK
jgi:hypothetical protein